MSGLLEVQGVSRTFGATRAVDNVSFAVRPGELLGLIGPNGAGKSTLFNLIAGVMPPSGGKIVLDGTDVTGWKSYDMARVGVARTFQIPKPYRQLSVIENVMISAFLRERSMTGARDLADPRSGAARGGVRSGRSAGVGGLGRRRRGAGEAGPLSARVACTDG